MKNFFSNLTLSQIVLLELIFSFFIFTLGLSTILPLLEVSDLRYDGQEFSLMANSFLDGKLHIEKFGNHDCTMFDNKCYWGPAPFPAIILMPFVFLFNFFDLLFYQSYLQLFITFAIFLLCWRLARQFKYSFGDSLWLAFAFCFASVYIGIAFGSRSYYFAHAVTVLLLFLAIYEYFNHKRYWLIGLYFAFIFGTRFTAGFGILFFVSTIFFDKKLNLKNKIKNLTLMFTPVAISGLSLLYYNYVRFGKFFDNGYLTAMIGEPVRTIRDQNGLFNIKYISKNFYYYFLKLPESYFRVSPWGLSFFVVSPIFVKIFWANIKKNVIKFSWLTSLIILFFNLTYFSSGWWQFGPRYVLDFLPFWFLLLLFSFKGNQLNN